VKKIIFGIFEEGKLIRPLGIPITVSPDIANWIIAVFFCSYVPVRREYIAFDFYKEE